MAPTLVICRDGQGFLLVCMTLHLCGAGGAPLDVGGAWALSAEVIERV